MLKHLRNLKVVIFDQKRESLDESKTLFQLIGDGQDFVHLANGTRKHVMSYLENFLFAREQVNRPISTLSGGEKNRLQLALFMKQSADLWIFDEPTNDLDIETIELLERELTSYDAPVIIVGHDRAFLDNTCTVSWVVHNKTIETFTGGYSQVAPYLHALELEKKAKLNTKETKSKDNQAAKKKSNNKSKDRLKKIESEIETLELSIDKIKEKIAKIDYTEKDARDDFQKLDTEQKQFQTNLDNLMTEWSELEE